MYANYRLTRRRMLRNLAAAGGIAAAGTASMGLAGCSGTGGAPGGGTESGTGYQVGSSPLKVQLNPEIDGVVYPDPFDAPRFRDIVPFGDPNKTFRVVGPDYPGFDYDENNFSRWLEQKTGVKINYEVVPSGDEGRAKINAMISSGDLPDAFLNGNGAYFSRSEVALYGQQGLFMTTNQLIDENCPEHLELFKTRPEARPYLTAPDGEMYGFVHYGECFHCYSAESRMWVNKKWMAKVGLEQPTTSDELRALLVAFRDENPSGLPGSVPMADCRPSSVGGADGGGMVNYLLAPFTYPALNMIDKQGDQLLFAPVQDSYREGLRWIRSLFAENLIDTNSFTQTPEQYKRRMDNTAGPLIGAGYGYSQGGLFATPNTADKNSTYYDYIPLAPVNGPDGSASVAWRWEPYANLGVIITSKCSDPVMMARWADAQIGVFSTLNGGQGPQGINDGNTYAWATEGELGIDGRQGVWKKVEGNPDEKNVIWYGFGSINGSLDFRNGEVAVEGSGETALYQSGKAYEPFAVAKERYFPEQILTVDQASQLSEIETNLAIHLSQAQAQFCLGQLDINDDAAWSGYVEKFKQIGSESYLQIQNEAMKAGG